MVKHIVCKNTPTLHCNDYLTNEFHYDKNVIYFQDLINIELTIKFNILEPDDLADKGEKKIYIIKVETINEEYHIYLQMKDLQYDYQKQEKVLDLIDKISFTNYLIKLERKHKLHYKEKAMKMDPIEI